MEINDKNYYSNEVNKEWLSVSQLKAFMKCPAREMAVLNGEWVNETTDALLLGSLVDAMLLGTQKEVDEFLFNHPEMISSRGPSKGELKAGFKIADKMVDRAKSDPFFMSTLRGEHQTILTGEIYGVPFRGKLDVLGKNYITDLKTCKSITEGYYDSIERRTVNFVEKFDYLTQGAIYQELVRQKTNRTLPFFLSCISKEEVTDIEVIHIDDETLNNRLLDLEPQIIETQEIKLGNIEARRCGRCDYCKATKKLIAPINFNDIGKIEDINDI